MACIRFVASMKKILLLLMIFAALAAPFAHASEYYYDLNDKKFTYDQLVAKPKTILLIWTTWCPICRKTIKRFTGTKNLRDDINIVFLDSGERRPEVLASIKQLQVPEAMYSLFYRDPFQEIMNHFYVAAVPTVIFFQDGKIVKTAHTLTSGIIEQVYPPEKNKATDARNN